MKKAYYYSRKCYILFSVQMQNNTIQFITKNYTKQQHMVGNLKKIMKLLILQNIFFGSFTTIFHNIFCNYFHNISS